MWEERGGSQQPAAEIQAARAAILIRRMCGACGAVEGDLNAIRDCNCDWFGNRRAYRRFLRHLLKQGCLGPTYNHYPSILDRVRRMSRVLELPRLRDSW